MMGTVLCFSARYGGVYKENYDDWVYNFQSIHCSVKTVIDNILVSWSPATV